MLHKLFAVGLAVVGLALAAPAAHAKTTKCAVMDVNDNGDFPAVSALRAHDLPAKTDGYASPCVVARAGANQVQLKWRNKAPKTVKLYGTEWWSGTWRVSYHTVKTADGAYGKFKLTRGKQSITFDGAS
jgi:hypothetical protein